MCCRVLDWRCEGYQISYLWLNKIVYRYMYILYGTLQLFCVYEAKLYSFDIDWKVETLSLPCMLYSIKYFNFNIMTVVHFFMYLIKLYNKETRIDIVCNVKNWWLLKINLIKINDTTLFKVRSVFKVRCHSTHLFEITGTKNSSFEPIEKQTLEGTY